ncbi:hypothetical protein [Streptomyces sp. SID13031]|uniref:sunset domain-containing protein n=1 Tax=Streptomyces sp. SID13031 TaxID=2706046 RepID=UPI0013CBAC55|nr:hypothetical protein [Streptomyces sp. SID13031]NEA34768.1 hypothetical protein [Streptomyces sp. SID13031]
MAYLFRNNWPWTLLAFLIGAIITWLLLNRRERPPVEVPAEQEAPAEEKTLVGAGVAAAGTTPAAAPLHFEEPVEPFDQALHEPEPEPAPEPEPEPEPVPEPEPGSESEPVLEAEPESEPAEESGGDPEPLPAPQEVEGADPEAKVAAPAAQPAFSVRMDVGEPTLFDNEPATDEVQVKAETVPAGRYGEGSADAVAHQGPPDGFTIKGNAQSMLFHTPESPYYGRTKAEVWFRTEADAERSGFTKYVRKPRKSSRPAG